MEDMLALLAALMGRPEGPDHHKHRCGFKPTEDSRGSFVRRHEYTGRGCGFVWEHDRPKPHEDYHAAHLCPNCGNHETWRYFGKLKPGKHAVRARRPEYVSQEVQT